MTLRTRDWVPAQSEARVQSIAKRVGESRSVLARLDALVTENRDIHEKACFNLNPAT
ncbi:MAG TPA: serine hydroxymethyltransferase, partial [Octadecabacter sp.]|nr:serine hydroxymethyltransferase [Octadecabacter sp.]